MTDRTPSFLDFFNVPASIEAPKGASVSLLRRVAVVAVLLGGVLGAVASIPAGHHADSLPFPASSFQGEALTSSQYGAVIDAVQAKADAELGAGRVYIIHRDRAPESEAKRLSKALGSETVDDGAIHAVKKTGAWEMDTGAVCIVSPPDPTQTPAKRFVVTGATRTVTGDVTSEDTLLWSLHHEIGHCLGGDEMRADTFAALMAAKTVGGSVDILPTMATYRELDEWTGMPDDDHEVSTSVATVARSAAAMRADAAFMSKPWKAIYSLADSIARGADEPTLSAHKKAVRSALWDADSAGMHYAITQGGVALTDLSGWISSNKVIPEIGRIAELRERLTRAPYPTPLPMYSFDSEASSAAAWSVAGFGDPTAALVAKAMGTKPADIPVPHLAKDAPAGARVVPFDVDSQRIVVSRDRGEFCIKGQDGRTASAGTHDAGITKQIDVASSAPNRPVPRF